MKYCSHCGAELVDDAVVCPKCGCAVDGTQSPVQNTKTNQSVSTLSIVGLVFAFLWPLIGLIISIIAKNNAKSIDDTKSYSYAKTGMIISIVLLVLSVVLGVLFGVIAALGMINSGNYPYM